MLESGIGARELVARAIKSKDELFPVWRWLSGDCECHEDVIPNQRFLFSVSSRLGAILLHMLVEAEPESSSLAPKHLHFVPGVVVGPSGGERWEWSAIASTRQVAEAFMLPIPKKDRGVEP
jgi:hypothetical protein